MEQNRSIFIIFIAIVLRFGIVENYRILGLIPIPFKSHMAMFERVMKGLAEKGHEVDVLSHFPQANSIPRYNDLSIRGDKPTSVKNITVDFITDIGQNEFKVFELMCKFGGTDACETVFNSATGLELKNSKRKYDLVITHMFGSDCMLGFAHHFKVPTIGVITSVSLPWTNDRIGNPDNPSYITNFFAPYVAPYSLRERIFNTLILMGVKLGYDYKYQLNNKLARGFFGEDLPDLKDLAYNTSLILVNSHFSINQARPMVPNFVEVGGLHIDPPKPLPDKLEKYLNITSTKYKGAIYLSTGSMILSETFAKEKLKALFDAFKELPYKVLWKANRGKFPTDIEIPPNIEFESWMPQLDILYHPNVKLFVTHGGLLGSQEGIYCGVPLLGIPLFADQLLNLKKSATLGLARIVKYHDITKESILNSAKTLLEDPRYRDRAKMASTLFRDRPLSALATAIYWIEYVIRYKGAPHLRSVGANLPWYQYYLVDVVIVLFTTASVLIASIYYLLRVILQSLFYRRRNEKVKTN